MNNKQPNEQQQNSLDPTIVEAMTTGTIRDKQILLLAESEMGKFISSSLQRQPLSSSFSSSLNSYQRMLVHRLGDSFRINRLIESNTIVIEKTPNSAWPNVRLESLIVRQDASPSNTDVNLTSNNSSSALSISTNSSDKVEPSSPSCSNNPNPTSISSTSQPKTFKIMSRTLSQSSRPANRNLMPSTASSGSSTDGSLSESRRNEMSYEERQAAYLQARNRIFANSNHSSIENGTGESTTGSNSSSGVGPDEDRLSAITNNSKSNSRSESPSGETEVAIESKNSTLNVKLKYDSTRSNKLPAKLRPSATSFDPNAKAHGYEEVTIIEVDNQSITVPYQTPSKLYPSYSTHPPSEYPHAFPSDPRLTHIPPHPYKMFPHPSYPLPGPATSHPTYPAPSYHLSGMPPPLPIHMAPPGVMTPPPPFIQPSYQSVGESKNSTIISTAPIPPVPQIQSNNNNILPPDHKFGPNNNQPPVFNDSRPHEAGYNSMHTIRPHQNYPSITDSSSHRHSGPGPSSFPSQLPPPSQQQQQHLHHSHVPFNGPPPNGSAPDFNNFHPPPFPPHDTQPHQHHPNLNMTSGYPRHGPPHMEMTDHLPPSNGFSNWPNPSIPPPPLSSSNHFHSSQDHQQQDEKSGVNPAQVGMQNGHGTSENQNVFPNGDPATAATMTTGGSFNPIHQSISPSSIPSSSSYSTTGGNSPSCSFNSPATATNARLNHQKNGLHQSSTNNIATLSHSLDCLNFNHQQQSQNLGQPHHHRKNQKGSSNKNQIKSNPTSSNIDQNGRETNPISLSSTTATTTLLHHPLPPKPVWNLKLGHNLPSSTPALPASNDDKNNDFNNNKKVNGNTPVVYH